MNQLNMSIEDIHKQMKFNPRSIWYNFTETNCYAYALGIDIPEYKIIDKAYQPGTIGSIIFNIKANELNRMSIEEKMHIDFMALNISYSECCDNEISCDKFDNDYTIYQWIIALFLCENGDYHFMRKAWDNTWWHKCGYNLEHPIDYDDNFEKIDNPKDCKINDYKYVKCLKLRSRIKR